MKTKTEMYPSFVEEYYVKYCPAIKNFISSRISRKEEAEDLTQEVFLRLLEYKQLINHETIRSFLFTVAKNLLVDYMRLLYKKEDYTSYIYEYAKNTSNLTEQIVLTNELIALVDSGMETLSNKRKEVYNLSLNEGLTVGEIAELLQMSYRTAECHLFLARKSMRQYMTNEIAYFSDFNYAVAT